LLGSTTVLFEIELTGDLVRRSGLKFDSQVACDSCHIRRRVPDPVLVALKQDVWLCGPEGVIGDAVPNAHAIDHRRS